MLIVCANCGLERNYTASGSCTAACAACGSVSWRENEAPDTKTPEPEPPTSVESAATYVGASSEDESPLGHTDDAYTTGA